MAEAEKMLSTEKEDSGVDPAETQVGNYEGSKRKEMEVAFDRLVSKIFATVFAPMHLLVFFPADFGNFVDF